MVPSTKPHVVRAESTSIRIVARTCSGNIGQHSTSRQRSASFSSKSDKPAGKTRDSLAATKRRPTEARKDRKVRLEDSECVPSCDTAPFHESIVFATLAPFCSSQNVRSPARPCERDVHGSRNLVAAQRFQTFAVQRTHALGERGYRISSGGLLRFRRCRMSAIAISGRAVFDSWLSNAGDSIRISRYRSQAIQHGHPPFGVHRC